MAVTLQFQVRSWPPVLGSRGGKEGSEEKTSHIRSILILGCQGRPVSARLARSVGYAVWNREGRSEEETYKKFQRITFV